MSGSPIGLTPESNSACSYHSGSASRIASCKTEPKPTRWITSDAGALPARNPGIRISFASARAAREVAFSTSAAGTSTWTSARQFGSSLTVVFIGRVTLKDQFFRRAGIVRRATEKSIAKARPRPTGPVTSQARVRSSSDTGLPAAFEDLPLEPRPLPGGHRTLRPRLVELDPSLQRQVEQPLLLDPLPRPLEEEPGEQPEPEESSLDHHHHPGRALVGQWRDPPIVLTGAVDRIEHRARPHQDVAEDRAGEAHRDHVADLPRCREPHGLRQRPEDGHPHLAAEEDEGDVLERMQRRSRVGGVVEPGDVPEVEVERPERECDQRVGEDPQTVKE